MAFFDNLKSHVEASGEEWDGFVFGCSAEILQVLATGDTQPLLDTIAYRYPSLPSVVAAVTADLVVVDAAADVAAGGETNVRGTPLTGLSLTSADGVSAVDTVLQAFGKIEARLPVQLELTANFNNASTTLANVTDLSFAVTAGRKYSVEVIGRFQTNATNTGISLGLFQTAANGLFTGYMVADVRATAVSTALRRPLMGDTEVLSTGGVNPAGTPHSLNMHFIYDCTTSGTLGIQFGSSRNSSQATLLAGSTLIYQRLT